MAWEKRSGSNRRYYFRSVRDGKKVRKQYIGRLGDPVVRLIADGDKLSQAEGKSAVDEVRVEQAEYTKLESTLDAIEEAIRKLQEINLLICGYRRRRGKLQEVKLRNMKPKPSGNDNTDEPVTRELFDHLAHKANYGDPHAAQRLREILRDHPEIWDELGDLTRHAERTLIGILAAGDFALGESVTLKAAELRKSLLAEASDQVLERLLIDYLVVCWLEAEAVRVAAVQPQQFKQDTEFWARRQERAAARYLAAIEELGTLRGLLNTRKADQPTKRNANTSFDESPT